MLDDLWSKWQHRGTTYELVYHLPVTKVRFTATHTHVHDDILEEPDKDKDVIVSAAAEMMVGADNRTSFTAKIRTGWFANTNASLALTDDQRLTSASGTSEGQLGAVAGGVIGALVFAAGIAAGVPAAAPVGAATARITQNLRLARGGVPAAAEDPVEVEYKSEHPTEHAQLLAYRELHHKLDKEAQTLAAKAVDEPKERDTVLAQMRTLDRLRSRVDAKLDQLKLLFQTWRATTLTTWSEDLTAEVEVDLLPSSGDGAFDPTKLDQQLKNVWEKFGLMVVVIAESAEAAKDVTPAADKRSANGVYEREPHQVRWMLWKQGAADGERMSIRTATALVCDARSPAHYLEFRQSVWAKRTMKATFASSGSMSGLEVGSTSSMAAAAQAIGAIPGPTTTALTQAGTFSDQLASLRTKSLFQEVDRAKKQLELKQTEVASAGLAATEGDQAELLRLKQQVDIAETSAKLRPDAFATSDLKTQTALIDATRELEVARRQLQSETDLAEFRVEIEKLQADGQKQNPEKKSAPRTRAAL